MDNYLPDIDSLIKMAQDDPEELEQLRENLCSQLIKNAPEHYQRRLKGIQFQIDMTRRKSGNSLHSCIKISELMLQSYQKLQAALTELNQSNDKNVHTMEFIKTNSDADVIDFKSAAEKS